MILSFENALAAVREKTTAFKPAPSIESAPLDRALGRILAEAAMADRDYPSFHRSIRDGFAVRSADITAAPVELEVRGEVRAGSSFSGEVGPGECVSIMTGAPLPSGADAVVMVEHTEAGGSGVRILRSVVAFEHIVKRGSEARAGDPVLAVGRRMGSGEIGLLASIGLMEVRVFRQPVVAVLSTGDEIVSISQKPEWFQIRNSNSVMLAAEVASAGGKPRVLDVARDDREELRRQILQGLEADLLLTSGGVSAGKHDLVEGVLKELGAEFFFDGVELRPGRPLVFGAVRGKLFFGLPGNPVSSYVTCSLFARPAIGVLGGGEFSEPLFLRARLAHPVKHKPQLTAFMPARVFRSPDSAGSDPVIELVGWQGSGDLVGVAAANCFLVLHPGQTAVAAGDWVDVMFKELDY
ncbi:MAG: molybdopterin molybdotransferase MoeA [Terriglobia bacterium]